MRVRELHEWDVTPAEARKIQEKLRRRVKTVWKERRIRRIAAADVSFPSKREALAAVVVVSYPGLEVQEEVAVRRECTFPYVPGLLAFRETPAVAEALRAVSKSVDLILCDGQGLAHPRGMGLACHIGLVADKPTIGCAKSRLYGEFREPGKKRGSWSALYGEDGSVIGAVLRTRENVTPVFVSIGHKIDLETAVEVVLGCSPRYRIPEPLRLAHQLATRSGRDHVAAGKPAAHQ